MMFIDPYDTGGNIAAGCMPPWIGSESSRKKEPYKCGCCCITVVAEDGEFLTKEKNGLPPLNFYCYECIDAKE